MRVPLLILIALTTLANCQSCTFERENEEIEFIVDAQKVDLIDPILGQAQVECNGELKNVWRSCRFCDFQIINAASLSVRYLEVDSLHSEFENRASSLGKIKGENGLKIWDGHDITKPPIAVLDWLIHYSIQTAGVQTFASKTGKFTVQWSTSEVKIDLTKQDEFNDFFEISLDPIPQDGQYAGCACPTHWLNDLACDRECDTEECKFDGGDCIGKNGLHYALINPAPSESGSLLGLVSNTQEIKVYSSDSRLFVRFDQVQDESNSNIGSTIAVGPDYNIYTATSFFNISQYDNIVFKLHGNTGELLDSFLLPNCARISPTLKTNSIQTLASPGRVNSSLPIWYTVNCKGDDDVRLILMVTDEKGDTFYSFEIFNETQVPSFRKIVFVPNTKHDFVALLSYDAGDHRLFYCSPDFSTGQHNCKQTIEIKTSGIGQIQWDNYVNDMTVTGDGHVLLTIDRSRILKISPHSGDIRHIWANVAKVSHSHPSVQSWSSWDISSVAWGPDNNVYISDFSAFVQPFALTPSGALSHILGPKTFGIMQYDFVSGPIATHCRAQLISGSISQVGNRVQVRIESRTWSDMLWNASGADFSVVASGHAYVAQYESTIAIILRSNFEYLGEGIYIASFTPRAATKYSITVTLGSREIPIQGSPFSIEAIPSQTSALHSSTSLPSQIVVTQGERLSFKIKAKDRFQNLKTQGGDKIVVKVIQYGSNEDEDHNEHNEKDVTSKVLPDVVILDNGNGVYYVNATVRHPGEYSFLIMIQEKNQTELIGGKDLHFIVYDLPYDIREIEKRLNSGVVLPAVILQAMGIVVAISLLAFNVILAQRKYKIIRMSSHRINNIILLGSILAFVAAILQGQETQCQARVWTINLSFTITFGALFAKTWRVHKLLNNERLSRVSIQDSMLFRVLAILVSLDVAFLLLWYFVDPLKPKDVALPLEDDKESPLVKHRKTIIQCSGENTGLWIGSAVAIKGLLLCAGVWLSFKTRNVEIAAMNDSRYIAIAIYNVFVLLGPGVLITLYMDDIDAKFLLTSVEIFFVVITTICLLFVPKLMAVYRGEDEIWTDATTSEPTSYETEQELQKLRSKISTLEKKLQKYETQERTQPPGKI